MIFRIPQVLICSMFLLLCSNSLQCQKIHPEILFYEIDPLNSQIHFAWKNTLEKGYKNFASIKQALDSNNRKLVFAMNGGMFLPDFSPQGLYIERGVVLKEMDTLQHAYGNFYMQPNGVFYITRHKIANICVSKKLKNYDSLFYATQSGPMLVIDGMIHPAFNMGSKNVNIRNGVGVLPNGNLLFAISEEKINFYDFAMFFKNNGCLNALYLDGFVSRVYLPSKNKKDLNGRFGVIIYESR